MNLGISGLVAVCGTPLFRSPWGLRFGVGLTALLVVHCASARPPAYDATRLRNELPALNERSLRAGHMYLMLVDRILNSIGEVETGHQRPIYSIYWF